MIRKVLGIRFQVAGVILFSIIYLLFPVTAKAVTDPLARPNNFVGIHVLFPSELNQAKDLVNSSGGQWGYVTIPIQMGERNLEEWQKFMDNAKKLHMIPLIRLATQPDPHNTSVWRKPNASDILDFANFLSSLNWPTKNKYVILFNEVNRFDEWGGEYPDPVGYSNLVSYANEVFKKNDPNFYLILSGMDAAAPNDYKQYINGFTYLEDLVSGSNVTSEIDGFSSHSYPNPGFSAPPLENNRVGIATYRFEYDLLNAHSPKKLPVFITETGWSDKSIPDSIISKYYQMTFKDIWSKDRDKIVAITPFLLTGGGGQFEVFSFLKDGAPKDYFKTVVAMSKVKGNPETDVSQTMLAKKNTAVLASQTFKQVQIPKKIAWSPYISLYFKTIFGLN